MLSFEQRQSTPISACISSLFLDFINPSIVLIYINIFGYLFVILLCLRSLIGNSLPRIFDLAVLLIEPTIILDFAEGLEFAKFVIAGSHVFLVRCFG